MRNLLDDESSVVEELKDLLLTEADSVAGSVCYPIEVHVSGDSAVYPGLSRLARQWEAFFDYADAHFASRGFPEEEVALLEKELSGIANRIRSDKDFWQALERRLLLPARHQESSLGLQLCYDPVEVVVKTCAIRRDRISKAQVSASPWTTHCFPPALVARIIESEPTNLISERA